jgi:rhodanese-related sulfurtransferase
METFMSNPESISPADFKKLLEQPPEHLFILDVRNPSEYREYNINGYLIPFVDLPTRTHELPSKDTYIIVHCAHGVRSHHAAEFLRHEGYTHCVSLEGGLEEFKRL